MLCKQRSGAKQNRCKVIKHIKNKQKELHKPVNKTELLQTCRGRWWWNSQMKTHKPRSADWPSFSNNGSNEQCSAKSAPCRFRGILFYCFIVLSVLSVVFCIASLSCCAFLFASHLTFASCLDSCLCFWICISFFFLLTSAWSAVVSGLAPVGHRKNVVKDTLFPLTYTPQNYLHSLIWPTSMFLTCVRNVENFDGSPHETCRQQHSPLRHRVAAL